MQYKPIEYLSKIKSALKKTAVTGLAGLVLVAGGCMSDTGVAVDVLKIKLGHQGTLGTPEEAAAETDNVVFNKDCQPYDKSEVTNDFVESPVWRHYKNRNESQE